MGVPICDVNVRGFRDGAIVVFVQFVGKLLGSVAVSVGDEHFDASDVSGTVKLRDPKYLFLTSISATALPMPLAPPVRYAYCSAITREPCVNVMDV